MSRVGGGASQMVGKKGVSFLGGEGRIGGVFLEG